MSTRLGRSCLLALLLASPDQPACRADRTPPVTTLEGHKGWVGAVAFSPDGKRLATASADRTARIWHVEGGRQTEVLEGHTDSVCAVAFAPDGVVVTGGHDGTVRLWRPMQQSKVLESRRGAVMAVAVSPDGKTVAAGGLDGVITLLDPSGKKTLTRLIGHKTWVNSLAFSSDGSRLASGSSDGTARLWNTKTSKVVKTFALADPREIRCVALSPDGKTIAAGVRFGAVKVWDVSSGKKVASMDAHEGDAWSVCFTPDGKTLVSGGGDWGKPGTVRQWETKTWTGGVTLAHPAEVLCVTVSPDGRWLTAGGSGRTVRMWDLRPPAK
jgi:WD40 repeat protein